MSMFQSISMRFVKGFIAGGLGSLGIFLSVGVDTSDLKKLGLGLLTAFISGGLLAIEKAYNWQS